MDCQVEFIQTFKKDGKTEARDLLTGDAAEWDVYKPGPKYMRMTVDIGDLYFRVEPISKREFEEAKAKDGAKNP